MSFLPLFIASVDGPGSSGSIMIVGFLLVVVVLAMLAAITAGIGSFFTGFAKRATARAESAKASAAAATAATSAAEESAAEEDPVLIAVIAAAVHMITGDRAHRIVSIRSSSSEGWAQEGRRQIFSSHRIR
jgi:sodium pump decarboxylase gamma subunit